MPEDITRKLIMVQTAGCGSRHRPKARWMEGTEEDLMELGHGVQLLDIGHNGNGSWRGSRSTPGCRAKDDDDDEILK